MITKDILKQIVIKQKQEFFLKQEFIKRELLEDILKWSKGELPILKRIGF